MCDIFLKDMRKNTFTFGIELIYSNIMEICLSSKGLDVIPYFHPDVESIDLSDNNLTSLEDLPERLSDFPGLMRLNLSNNLFTTLGNLALPVSLRLWLHRKL